MSLHAVGLSLHDGTIPHHQVIHEGNLTPVIRYFREEMKDLAANLEFEKAEIIRKKIDYLESYQAKSAVANVKAVPDHDIRVGLIILQVDVERRLKLLDERILEEKRILFGIYDCEFNAINSTNELMRLVIRKCFIEIGTYTLANVLCLSYIE